MLTSNRARAAAVCLTILCFQPTSFSQSALSFDGVDDYVEVPDDPSLDLQSGFTIAAWVFLESYTEWASIVTKGGLPFDLGEGNNYTIHQSGPAGGSDFGHLRFTAGIPGLPINPYLESSTQIPLQEWHHVAATFDGERLRFFFDGRPDGEHALVATLDTNDEPLHIGVDFPGGDEYWHGCLDDVLIFNRALTRADLVGIAQHASSLRSGLVGFWRFNEGAGDIAHDRSRAGNDGFIFGEAIWKTPGAPGPFFPRIAGNQPTGKPAPECMLLPNHPNPFNPETEIQFQLPEAAHVVLKVFNACGEEVRTLAQGQYAAGAHRVIWDGRNSSGNVMASGVYWYQLGTNGFSQIRKMTLLR